MDGATNETIDFSIYSLAGELVYNTIMTGPNIGRVEIQWNAKSTKNKTVSSGTYFVRMSTSGLSETQKIVFIK
jgi:flagellar hook assembly protein FlgD